MNRTASDIPDARPLTPLEHDLTAWMLAHGLSESTTFLAQLELATVSSRCPCGCASIDFAIGGVPRSTGGLRILADFVFGEAEDLAGIFVFETNGVLAGLEVYGLAGDAPRVLPRPSQLRPFGVEISK